MRLTDTQIRIIKTHAAECFGPNAHVWLFGSRVDDDAHGGDIDLYVELSEPIDDDAWRALRFNGALQQAFGAQRIDVITRGPSEPLKPIHETAKRTGVALNDLAARFARVLDLVDREARHLAEVTQRFFGDAEAIDREWLAKQLAAPEGIDRLESFGAKFSRLQDTLSDKLLPLFLRVAGELPGTAVENLDRVERLGIIHDTQEWLGARGLRNRLVHEYIDDLDALAASLNVARRFATVLIEAAHAFRSYAAQRLGTPFRQTP